MPRGGRVPAVLSAAAVSLLGVLAVAEETEFAARLKDARQSVLSGAGKEYYEGAFADALSTGFDRRLEKVNECRTRTKDNQRGNFHLLLNLGVDGRVAGAMAWPQSKTASCYLEHAKKDVFPKPPSAGLWVPVALRFGMQEAIEAPVPAPATPTLSLIAGLSSKDPGVRSGAAWQLAGAREMRAEARAALAPLRADPDREVRYGVAWALAHLAVPSGVEAPTHETPPRPTRQKRPEYPKRAFAAGIEGTVLVALLVGEQGEIAHLEIRRSVPELDAAATACIRKWAFEPGRVGGIARPVVAHAPVTFRIY